MPENVELRALRWRIANGNARPGDKAKYKMWTGRSASQITRVSPSAKQRKGEASKLKRRIEKEIASLADKERYRELTGRDWTSVEVWTEEKKIFVAEKKRLTDKIRRGTATVEDEQKYKSMTGRDSSTVPKRTEEQISESNERSRLRDRIRKGTASLEDMIRYEDLMSGSTGVRARAAENAKRDHLQTQVARRKEKVQPSVEYFSETKSVDHSSVTKKRERENRPSDNDRYVIPRKSSKKQVRHTSDSNYSMAATTEHSLRARKKEVCYAEPEDSSSDCSAAASRELRARKKQVRYAEPEDFSDSDGDFSVAATREHSLRARKKQILHIDSDSEDDDIVILEENDDSSEDDDMILEGTNNLSGPPEDDAKLPAAKLPTENRGGGAVNREDGGSWKAKEVPAVKFALKGRGSGAANPTHPAQEDFDSASTSGGSTNASSVVGSSKKQRDFPNTVVKQEDVKQEDIKQEDVKQEEEEGTASTAGTSIGTDDENAYRYSHESTNPSMPYLANSSFGQDGQVANDSSVVEDSHDLDEGVEESPREGSELARGTAPHEGEALLRAPMVDSSWPASMQETLTIRFCRKDLTPEEFIDVDAPISPDTFLQDVFKSDGTRRIRKLSKEQKKALADKKKEVVLDYINEVKGRIYRRYFSHELEAVSTLKLFETIPRNQKGNIIDGASHPITFHVNFKDTVAALDDESDDEDCYL